MSTTTIKHYYGKRAKERRRQFNKLIDGCNLVLMNNITEIDPDIYYSWVHNDPTVPEDCGDWDLVGGTKYTCRVHGGDVDIEDWNEDIKDCEYKEDEPTEIYQWYAVSSGDAEFLGRHNQHIAYSETLDTHFLAITHFGTAWDYVDSMVEDFADCYTGLDEFEDKE